MTTARVLLFLLSAAPAAASAAAQRFDDASRTLPWSNDSAAEAVLSDLDGDGDLDALFAALGRTGASRAQRRPRRIQRPHRHGRRRSCRRSARCDSRRAG